MSRIGHATRALPVVQRTQYTALTALFTIAAGTFPAFAMCPTDPPPVVCDNAGQFVGGRWDLAQFTGSYAVSGDERFYPFIDDLEQWDDYRIDGTLAVSMVGGAADNYLEVGCDGTVTGQFTQSFQGAIDKEENISYYDPISCTGAPTDMNWTVAIERTVSVTGQVTGVGQLDLELSVDTATLDVEGSLEASEDCFFFTGSMNVTDFDVSGDTEQVQLSGGYDPDNHRFSPDIITQNGDPWIDDILHRVKLNGQHDSQDDSHTVSPTLDAAAGDQPGIQEYNLYLLQTPVDVTGSTRAEGEPKTPAVTSLELQEPSQYLRSVNVSTPVTAEIDWRGEPPGEVEFSYGGLTETVPGADTVTWHFDAGNSGSMIVAVAISGGERSEPFTIQTPKVTIPGWAGTPADWNAQSGVTYDGMLAWPVTLETTRVINTVSLFAGIWGITGSAMSDFNATANSDGSPGAGDMNTEADFSFAGRTTKFAMEGDNQTTLSCDDLTTNGSATAEVSIPPWQSTLNPLSLVPGLQAGACALSRVLCGVVNSVGIKASAEVTLEGSGTYMGQDDAIRWDSGSLGGSITGKISARAGVPPPLSAVASVEVYGSATGCIDFQVAPDLELNTIGGTINAGASAALLGLSTSAEAELPFGDGCGKSAQWAGRFGEKGAVQGWVPADGQLAMAATLTHGSLLGIAVWTEAPVGQARPLGDLYYRFFRDGSWSAIRQLTSGDGSDIAPSVSFDDAGRALVVFQRSSLAPPVSTAEVTEFANGYELHWALVDGVDELTLDSGQITNNASHDFGPRLRQDRSGKLHVFWQQASGVEISGTPQSPVSLMLANWSGVSWSAETIAAAGLTHTFGWSPAALSPDAMMIGLVVDTDEDLETSQDRELFRISGTNGVWSSPEQVTNNNVADDAVLAAYDADNNPLLLWREGSEVLEVRGDVLASPAAAFTSANPTLDEGVSAAFASGQISVSGAGSLVAWTHGLEVNLVKENRGVDWSVPEIAFASGESEAVHFLAEIEGTRLVGYAVREFVPGSIELSPMVLPAFELLGIDQVFRNGFE